MSDAVKTTTTIRTEAQRQMRTAVDTLAILPVAQRVLSQQIWSIQSANSHAN